jgi:RNA polymerase sigma factor (sigma-70 family)
MPLDEIEPGFADLIRKVRAGDAEAAVQLVQRFETELRIIARAKLNDPQLRRIVDSMDICQSILGAFFVRASAGQFDIDTPEQLHHLLGAMIRNKVTDHARRQKSQRRDIGRIVEHVVESLPLANNGDTPSQIAEARDLAAQARNQLAIDELEIIDRRIEGLGWNDIALELNSSPEAVRKKMKRALDRVAKSIGVDE